MTRQNAAPSCSLNRLMVMGLLSCRYRFRETIMNIYHVSVVIAILMPLSIHAQAPDLPEDVQDRPYCARCIEVVRPLCTLTLVRRRREDSSAITLPPLSTGEILASESAEESTTPDIKLKTVATPECDDETTEPSVAVHTSNVPRVLSTEEQTPYAGHPHCYEFLSVSYRVSDTPFE
ncbi:hypothetical protein DdX_10851 [Ditylenchus destructor]|uniref:Uncharacterized protein n=1 Tax=Ditylenchus destructor TaxID=166010 RepID=A0AAD4N3L4_9BILA|nr:hypothetical protein DdX_10851 [Ditylenchus destructor]